MLDARLKTNKSSQVVEKHIKETRMNALPSISLPSLRLQAHFRIRGLSSLPFSSRHLPASLESEGLLLILSPRFGACLPLEERRQQRLKLKHHLSESGRRAIPSSFSSPEFLPETPLRGCDGRRTLERGPQDPLVSGAPG